MLKLVVQAVMLRIYLYIVFLILVYPFASLPRLDADDDSISTSTCAHTPRSVYTLDLLLLSTKADLGGSLRRLLSCSCVLVVNPLLDRFSDGVDSCV